MLHVTKKLLGVCGLLLSLSLAMAQTSQVVGGVVSVTLGNGATAKISFPDPQAWQDSFQKWTLHSVNFSPDSTLAVVLFSWSVPKYRDAKAYLVRSNGVIEGLKNSTVWRIQWTEDGKYIFGFGDNTVRLWNLNGGRKQLSFGKINDYSYSKKSICLDVDVQRYKYGEYINREYIQTYSVPMLKRLKSVPALEGTYCEHQP